MPVPYSEAVESDSGGAEAWNRGYENEKEWSLLFRIVIQNWSWSEGTVDSTAERDRITDIPCLEN